MLTGAARGMWRYFGFDDLKRITTACLIAGAVAAAAVPSAGLTGVARAVLLHHPLCAAVEQALETLETGGQRPFHPRFGRGRAT